jgi:hypothetical protein
MVCFMNSVLRRLAISVMCLGGAAATVATSAPSADVSGESGPVTVVLDADEPERQFTAQATLDVEAVVAEGTGQIGVTVILDADAQGSLSFRLRSETEEQSGDIVDTQAQGTTRIGIDAFAGCADTPCDEPLTLEFRRTDTELDGTLGLTFTLDGLASTETEPTEPGTITFQVDD